MPRSPLPLVALAILLAFPSLAQTGDNPENKHVIQKLNTIVIDKVDFDKLDIATVVQFLIVKSRELDPAHTGVKIQLNLPPKSSAQWFHIHREVSITLDNVPLVELLNYIVEQTNLSFKITHGVVVMAPLEVLRAPSNAKPTDQQTQRKLHAIFLDQVDFKNADISEVLEFLRVRSEDLDPDHVGLKFYLEWPQPSAAKSLHLHREVNLTRNNVSVLDLLNRVCEQTNLSFKVIHGVVVVAPPSLLPPDSASP